MTNSGRCLCGTRDRDRNNRQDVHLSSDKDCEFGSASESSTTRRGTVVAEEYTLKHSNYIAVDMLRIQ